MSGTMAVRLQAARPLPVRHVGRVRHTEVVMASMESGERSLGFECVEALHALSRLLASIEAEGGLTDVTREAASTAAAAVGRAARLLATAGEEYDWRRRVEEQLAAVRAEVRELERRHGDMYRAMQEQEEWPAG